MGGGSAEGIDDGGEQEAFPTASTETGGELTTDVEERTAFAGDFTGSSNKQARNGLRRRRRRRGKFVRKVGQVGRFRCYEKI
jgi:hypothetical protein